MSPCECGCGETAARRFVAGHQNRRKGPAYEVRDCGYETPCWYWIGSITPGTGYGSVRHHGKTANAHRATWEATNGPIPAGMQLDHLCRTRACVNPDHLEVVTNTTNSRRGLRTKLTSEQVAAIREDPRMNIDIAPDYGITPAYVSNIKRGWVWRETHEQPRRRAKLSRA